MEPSTVGTEQTEPEPPAVGLDPAHIMQVGMGFWPAKTLLSAVELELFTRLGAESSTGEAIGEQLGLRPRGIYDFLDTLVALRLLERDGEGPSGRYRNTADTAAFLDKGSPAYIGGILEMANARLSSYWGDLTEALETGGRADRSQGDRGGRTRRPRRGGIRGLLRGPASAGRRHHDEPHPARLEPRPEEAADRRRLRRASRGRCSATPSTSRARTSPSGVARRVSVTSRPCRWPDPRARPSRASSVHVPHHSPR